MAADGRGLQSTHINENFAKLAESLYIADRKAREAVEMRAQVEKKIANKEKVILTNFWISSQNYVVIALFRKEKRKSCEPWLKWPVISVLALEVLKEIANLMMTMKERSFSKPKVFVTFYTQKSVFLD